MTIEVRFQRFLYRIEEEHALTHRVLPTTFRADMRHVPRTRAQLRTFQRHLAHLNPKRLCLVCARTVTPAHLLCHRCYVHLGGRYTHGKPPTP